MFSKTLKLSQIIGGVVGVGLLVWMLEHVGIYKILPLLGSVGWLGFGLFITFHLTQMLCSALGWWAIAPRGETSIHWADYVQLRWIREGVNNLLPVAQVGGEWAAARLMQQHRVPLGAALAGTVADLTIEMVTQILFTLVGMQLLVASTAQRWIAHDLAVGIGVATIMLILVFMAFHLGIGMLFERALLQIARWLGWRGVADIEGFNTALLSCYRDPPRIIRSAVWHSISWLLGGAEVCIALYFLGHAIGIKQGLVIESIGMAMKSAGFLVPSALGVQEGGYVIVCEVFGLSADVALALSFLKRLRELTFGIPAVLLWLRLSHRRIAMAITSEVSR